MYETNKGVSCCWHYYEEFEVLACKAIAAFSGAEIYDHHATQALEIKNKNQEQHMCSAPIAVNSETLKQSYIACSKTV